jgi:RNA polymerase sigma factor (sigma-70 family)
MDNPEPSEKPTLQRLGADTNIQPPGTTEKVDAVQAFSVFYRESLQPLVAFLMYQGASLADAGDLAQEALAAAFHSWERIQHPKAWTRRVASRALIRQISRVEDPSEVVPERAVLLPDRDISDWEEKHEILRLMRLLPPRQRQVLAWTLDGFKPSEIAAELGLKPEAVRANLKKARRAIVAHLDKVGEEER